MSALEKEIEAIVIRVLDSRPAVEPTVVDAEAAETAAKLARIMVKEFLSLNEAAFLLGMSSYQIKKALKQAEDGTSRNPIPARDLDGVAIVFHRLELIEWSKGRKGKTQLRDVSAR